MATIPDILKTISKDIQQTFEELVKLLLRKSLRPAMNPLGPNTRIVYNAYRGKYERGLIGSSPDDNINKYTYSMTRESLGWCDEILANFKVMAKFIKNNLPERFPAGNAKIYNIIKPKTKVPYNDKETKQQVITNRTTSLLQYKNFISNFTSRSMQNVIMNRKASFTYTTDIPYTFAFKQLESIGKDIIEQTDPSIDSFVSAKMSTAMLRVRLYNLEQDLANLSVEHPTIFDSYVEMIRIINSVPRTKITWVINLIATLSYQRWDDLTEKQRQTYIDVLGDEFIDIFISNELITILLQSDSTELILTTSYLYPLMKMLFIVFGYSKLTPLISDKCCEETKTVYKEKLQKHYERYRGAFYRRGDSRNQISESEMYENSCSDTNSNCSDINNCCPDPEPIDPCIYGFIRLFGDLYPTIVGLMGGTEEFPPESIEISCDDIPADYDSLSTIPEYLWRFNDYSYCRYIEYTNSRQMSNALNCKINSKVKYLSAF